MDEYFIGACIDNPIGASIAHGPLFRGSKETSRGTLEKDAAQISLCLRPKNRFFQRYEMPQATTLKPDQFRHLLRVTNATSRHPKRDCLVLLLGISNGMRVTEIA
jgi:hypothetical protein